MKKLLFVLMTVVALSFGSCGNSTDSMKSATDTVDTVMVDSTLHSCSCDSCACDTCICNLNGDSVVGC